MRSTRSSDQCCAVQDELLLAMNIFYLVRIFWIRFALQRIVGMISYKCQKTDNKEGLIQLNWMEYYQLSVEQESSREKNARA